MILRRSFLLITSLCAAWYASAQVTRFEFDYPNAIPLNAEKIDLITSTYWRIYRDKITNRGSSRVTEKNTSICYYPDGKLFYNGQEGTWTVLDGKVIDHQLHDKKAAGRLNFGGLFVVTAIDSRTLIMSKMLTSSSDMERKLSLRSSTTLTALEQPKNSMYTNHHKPLSKEEITALAQMNAEELFHSGFNVRNDFLVIHAPDTMQMIQLKLYR